MKQLEQDGFGEIKRQQGIMSRSTKYFIKTPKHRLNAELNNEIIATVGTYDCETLPNTASNDVGGLVPIYNHRHGEPEYVEQWW